MANRTHDEFLLRTSDSIQFRDDAISINSGTDGHLDLTADTSIDLNKRVDCEEEIRPGDVTDGSAVDKSLFVSGGHLWFKDGSSTEHQITS